MQKTLVWRLNSQRVCINDGIDGFQTRDYIKVGAELYIDRMLQTHGWDAPGNRKVSPIQFP